MPVPEPLVGRYKLYKVGTAKLIKWLAETASRCGNLEKMIRSMSGRLHQPESSKERIHTPLKAIEVRTHELITLATAILKSQPPEEVPHTIIQIAEDVIKGREECAEWYAAQALAGKGSLYKENESHRYFNEVLHRVLDLLLKARGRQSATDKPVIPGLEDDATHKATTKAKAKGKCKVKKHALSPDTDKLCNLFNILKVEQPSATPLGDQPAPLSHATTTASVDQNFKLEDDGGDLAFALWCFLQDLDDVRTYVRETWIEYSQGKVSFMAVSTVTDVAFGLLRSADEGFRKEHEQSTNWLDILKYLGLTFFTQGQTTWLCPAEQGNVSHVPDSSVNIVQLLSPIATRCLLRFRKDAGDFCDAKKQNKPPPTGYTTDRPPCSYDFDLVLCDLVPELHSISHSTQCEHLIIDEFIQGLTELHHNGKMPMWLISACQIYLDIYDLLGSHVEHGVNALQYAFKNNVIITTDLLNYSQESGDDLSDTFDAVERLTWVATAASRYENASNESSEGSQEKSSHNNVKSQAGSWLGASPLERKLPAHAGALLADLKFGLLDASCAIANHKFVILSTAHLYRALRAMGTLQIDWPDMEFVISSFKTKKPLVAKVGSSYSSEAAVRHYLMALGAQAKDLAPGSRPTSQRKLDFKEARRITITSPLFRSMSDRQHNWEQRGPGYSKSRTVEVLLQTLTEATDSEKKRRLRMSYTPLQLLATYKQSFLQDEQQLNFDHISLVLRCARLLDLVSQRISISSSTKKWLEGKLGTKASEYGHVALVSELLLSSATSDTITKISFVFEKLISASGKELQKRAQQQTSGDIPKKYWPKIESDWERRMNSRVMMCTMLDYANTKYTFSGAFMAAYHPRVQPEFCSTCIKECCDGTAPESATDPTGLDRHGRQKVVAYGTAIPECIIDEGRVAIEKDAAKFHAAKMHMVRHYFKEHARGKLSDAELQTQVQESCGLVTEPMQSDEREERGSFAIPWLFSVELDDDVFATMLKEEGGGGTGIHRSNDSRAQIPVDVFFEVFGATYRW